VDCAEELGETLTVKKDNPVAAGMLLLWGVALVLLSATVAFANGGPKSFLFLKTGEKFATQETAGPTVNGLTDYIGQKLAVSFEPKIMNDPVKAAESCGTNKPAAGIVTPGFYLQYGKTLGLEPVLETRREGVAAERYVLVVRKTAGDDPKTLEGKTVATTLALEPRYVIGVILQNKLGGEVRLKSTIDVEGAIFDMADGAKDASDAVLVEDGAWKLFESDPELGPKLKTIYRSEELPRDLVVRFGGDAAGVDAEKLKAVLKAMTDSEEGKTILRSIRVQSFVDLDKERLAKAEALFLGK
jgi:ABC-type phosphate/phosphonate transport system substrate-binding protein